LTHTLSTPAHLTGLDDLAALCKAAADPLRLAVLRILRGESYGVQELTYIFDMIQSRMSHHLKVLLKAGLVATRKEGTFVFYRRPLLAGDDPYRGFKESLFARIDAQHLPEEPAARMAAVREERDRSSRSFFDKNAARFQQEQDMIVTYDQVAGCLDDLLRAMALPSDAPVLEIGPGKGDLLAHLAARFDDVHALDTSEEMLSQTRAAMEDRGCADISYHHGDPRDALARGLRYRLIVMNMVLHHMASPAAALDTCRRLLVPGGVLLVADLQAHTQTWVREACGDLWLGFEPEELTDWAVAADLREGQRIFLGLKNGFGVQMRLFHHDLSAAGRGPNAEPTNHL